MVNTKLSNFAHFYSKTCLNYIIRYGEFGELIGVISKYVKTKDQILMVGCGNSKLSIDMHKSGYVNLMNIDISEVVVEQMKKLYKDCNWQKMDATSMTFNNEEFSVVSKCIVQFLQ